MSLLVRLATPADAETLHRFICELAEYEKKRDAVEVTPAELREQMGQDHPPFECLIAEDPSVPSDPARGFALFFYNYSTWRGRRGIHLEDLYVPPEHRGTGVGKALLATLARVATERGCARMEWWVLDWNTPAIDFYRALGATPMGDWTTFRLDRDALDQLATQGLPLG